MTSPPPQPAGSPLLIDEYFVTADPRLVNEVLASVSAPKLKALAAKWFDDPRPLLRELLLSYVDDGCDRVGHRPLVKQLFKLAEQGKDDELMAHFLCAFDRLVTHRLAPVQKWDPQSRRMTAVTELKNVTGVRVACPPRDRGVRKRSGLVLFGSPPHITSGLLRFSLRTRHYLQRRVFRYFRQVGWRDPVRFRKAVIKALVLYRDEHLASPEALLDSWSLVHLLYRDSRVLERRPRGVAVGKNASLKDLSFAPLYPSVWEGAVEDLLELIEKASARTVRLFAASMLRTEPEQTAAALDLDRLEQLLKNPHEEVQALALEFLRQRGDLATLPVSKWLELLTLESPLALLEICSLVRKHVAPSRLDLSQCVTLALSSVAPAAELGAEWALEKPVATTEDLEELCRAREARVPSARQKLCRHLLGIVGTSPLARVELVRDLVDSRYADVRAVALEFLSKDPPLTRSALFWTQIAESPYPDVQAFVIEFLGKVEERVEEGSVRHLWLTSLLSVHRGSKARRVSLERIGTRLAERPSEAEDLLPLAGMMLRSLRPAERRVALATIARAVRRSPELQDEISECLTGFTLGREVSE
ncbi:MAG: hypothetical protein DIJKHBIC_04433 [Thermoanaerobaculia bacterium]|nr:hypothetical protein [Thermoanaerobaculia bacterium]